VGVSASIHTLTMVVRVRSTSS